MLNLLSQKLDFDIVNLDDEKIELEGDSEDRVVPATDRKSVV